MTHWRNPEGGAELVIWGDYECSHTREVWRTVERLLDRFGQRLRLDHAPAVRADKEAGRAIGLRRTPTFAVSGEKWDGFYDLETLTELLS